ncbi:MAG: hypothetical protein V3V18_03375 [Methylococcales bacterium]
MNYYQDLVNSDDYDWAKWSEKQRDFSPQEANEFFVGVMLDQGQKAERAWDGAKHLIENHFNNNENFWNNIVQTSTNEVKNICQKGFNGKSYAINFTFNTFPERLISAANKIVREYDSDVRNIWNIKSSEDVIIIYNRFTEFEGIGDALAKMAQFILVRNYGVAGGKNNQKQMKIKPDILVRRVLYRTGISSSQKTKDVISAVEELGLKSPADFDAASWNIGREFCLKTNPKCYECPITKSCNYSNISENTG